MELRKSAGPCGKLNNERLMRKARSFWSRRVYLLFILKWENSVDAHDELRGLNLLGFEVRISTILTLKFFKQFFKKKFSKLQNEFTYNKCFLIDNVNVAFVVRSSFPIEFFSLKIIENESSSSHFISLEPVINQINSNFRFMTPTFFFAFYLSEPRQKNRPVIHWKNDKHK